MKFSTGSLSSSLIAEIITAKFSASWLSFSATALALAVFALLFETLATGFGATTSSSLTRAFYNLDDMIMNSANAIKAAKTIEILSRKL